MDNRTCKYCGTDISHRSKAAKFCRKNCATMWYQQNQTKLCTIEGCEGKVRAASMCATHYNQGRPSRHRKRQVSCVVCGKQVMRRVDNSRLDTHCCSTECRRLRQFGQHVGAGAYDWNLDAKRRARLLGCQVIEDVDRLEVMERDAWRCYLCGKDTSLVSDPFSPDSPTVDHVIALTNGGEHTMRNVRCCCLACNASKANRDAVISPAA